MFLKVLNRSVLFVAVLTGLLVGGICMADPASDMKQADEFISAKKYDDAIKLLATIQVSDANLAPQAIEMTGDCYRLKEDYANAAKSYESVLAKYKVSDDQGKRIRRWLIKCHIRIQEWAKVAKEIDATAAESPECAAWSYYALANYYRRFANYNKAIEAYAKTVPADKTLPAPDQRSVQTELELCYIGAGQWDNATSLVNKLSAQYPDSAPYWHRCVGAIYKGQKKYPEAIAELKQAITPKGAETARKLLGECYRDSLPPAEAAPLIMDLDDKYPTDGPYLPTIAGRMYQDMKQYDKAVSIFKSVITRFPNARWQMWDACYYIGQCYYAQGKGEEALAYIKEVNAKFPRRQVDFAIAYGKPLLYPAKKPAEAAELFEKTMAEHPKSDVIHEIRPMLIAACVESGRTDLLVNLLNAMASSMSADQKTDIMLSLVDYYVSVEKYKEGALICKDVLALAGSSDEARAHAEYQLGICYHSSNMDSAAQMAMRNVASRYSDSKWARKARGNVYIWSNYRVSRSTN